MNAMDVVSEADTDIAIVGGGPVGAALALALAKSGRAFTLTVLEARAEPTTDARPIALSHGSRLLLERLGAWGGFDATPIHHIHVSQRGGFGRVAIHASDAGVPALGYVVDYRAVSTALADAARACGCAYRVGARVTALNRNHDTTTVDYTQDETHAHLSARLTVVADGGDIEGLAPLKTTDYAQHALTARVRTDKPHGNVAYERFTPEGPIALLPFGAELSLVWTLAPERAAELKDADTAVFLAALQAAFGGRLGAFTASSPRASFPLALRHTSQGPNAGVIPIGNAAQTLHPVAGQGFNLGLRDAWELAHILQGVPSEALAHADTARAYQTRRRIDRNATVAATHGLVRLFSNDFFALTALRGVGMAVLGSAPPVRDLLARRMIFGARG